MRRGSRPAPALLLLTLVLASCAPAASEPRTVEVHGALTRTAASSGPEGWILTTADGTLLAVTVPTGHGNPMMQRCVRIMVDDDFPDVDDPLPALEQVMNDTGGALVIASFC